MNIKVKKLSLNKTTIRSLTASELVNAAGAWTGEICTIETVAHTCAGCPVFTTTGPSVQNSCDTQCFSVCGTYNTTNCCG